MIYKEVFVLSAIFIIGFLVGTEMMLYEPEPPVLEGQSIEELVPADIQEQIDEGGGQSHPLMIEVIKEGKYSGGDVVIERELRDQEGFRSYVVSYPSDDLKLYALMNIPTSPKPEKGFPVIILNHGYIPPTQYSTTHSYKSFSDYFSQQGYILFKPDYRGHGQSEGDPEGGHFSPVYTYDVLNLLASIKRLPDVDVDRIGMLGHSMGGGVMLRALVVSDDVKASVIVAGVVGAAEDLFYKWKQQANSTTHLWAMASKWQLVGEFGEPKENEEFWKKVSAINYVGEIDGPIQLHHGTNDESVPKEFSDRLYSALEQSGKYAEYFIYKGGNHNLSGKDRQLFFERTINFFDSNL